MRFIFIALLLVASTARAQSVIDGSAADIDPAIMKSALFEVTKELRDPVSAQARQVALIHPSQERPDVICGLINAKNGFGAYVGFKPFYYDVKMRSGGIVTDSPKDVGYRLQFLPLEWMGCDKQLGIKKPPPVRVPKH
ncbi:MAG: hypothetical protein WBH00_13275 [Xanthobacteraceae bacterium]